MDTTNQKLICLATGGAVAAAFVWLKYAKSAEKTRRALEEAGGKVSRALDKVEGTANTIQRRTEEIDSFVQEILQLGREQKSRAETVWNDTLRRFEETSDLVQKNVRQSSEDIATLVHDIRTGVKNAVSSKPSEAA